MLVAAAVVTALSLPVPLYCAKVDPKEVGSLVEVEEDEDDVDELELLLVWLGERKEYVRRRSAKYVSLSTRPPLGVSPTEEEEAIVVVPRPSGTSCSCKLSSLGTVVAVVEEEIIPPFSLPLSGVGN